MKNKYALITGILVMMLAIVKCGNINEPEFSSERYVGVWISESNKDGNKVLKRKLSFDKNKYGIEIKRDGSFIERKNSGWCGTPPIAYGNFTGSWKAESDSLLKVKVGYWGGTEEYQIKIISLKDDLLTVQYLYYLN